MLASAVADIQSTYGAAFVGLIVSTILYGVTLFQAWFYFGHYRNGDPIALKCFVVILLVLDTLHTILCIYSVYWYLILNFGNVDNLNLNMWAFNSQVDINALVGFLVQLFYARRVYILSNNVIFPVVIVVFGGICFALGFVFSARGAALHQFSRYGSLTLVSTIGMSSNTLADILIALSMCWYLYHSRTGVSRTDSVITTLMSYSISTGLLTSMLAIGMLVSFIVQPTKLICSAIFWPMGKCYVNSFLAILNNRTFLRERLSSDKSSYAIAMSSMQCNENPRKTGLTPVAVTVHPLGTLQGENMTAKLG